MGLSKTTRISILLAIDSVFFFVELGVGTWVHSLALVADAFHMLNDVLSLVVGLWAVKVAGRKGTSQYTFGWQRAETLGALVNGVFLVALCVSIFLEAIQRFVEPPDIQRPEIILIVGCLGLASNIIGLFLFHEHGHSHGGHDHGHGHGHSHGEQSHSHDAINDAEEGHAHAHSEDAEAADESGNVADVLPESRVADWPKSTKAAKRVSSENGDQRRKSLRSEDTSTPHHRRQKSSTSRNRTFSSVDDIPVQPSSFRRSIIDASRLQDIDSAESAEHSAAEDEDDDDATPNEPLLKNGGAKGYGSTPKPQPIEHDGHNHRKPKEPTSGGGGHGHDHGDLNMRGVLLHVMGDALGNIGVIAAALIIWQTNWSWRMYSDPAISLIITAIILTSAIPLVKAASRILLQAVPAGLDVDEIKEDIEELPGVVSCHHVHVWQLSGTKLVASLHVQLNLDIKTEGSARYMELAGAIRECLHEYGIHSSTIQPEFATNVSDDGCLLECPGGEGCDDQSCCERETPVDSDQPAHTHQ